MAYPTIASSANSNTNTAGTTHAIAIPSGILTGELMIGFMGAQGATTGTISWPGTWTELFEASGTTVPFSTAYKFAGASEAGFSNTTSVSTRSATRILRITGAHASTAPVIGTEVANVGTAPNPPSLDPSTWVLEDTLWIALCMIASNSGAASAAPANYSGLVSHNSGATSTGVAVAHASRQLTASSEDPGTFTSSPSITWRANTLAVRPAIPLGNPLLAGSMLTFV